MAEIDIHTFAVAQADGGFVIDVREPHEYVQGHVPGARLLPVSQVQAGVDELPRDARVYVICASGNRSGTVTDALVRAGYDAISVAGGTSAWRVSGYPLVTGLRATDG